MSDYTVPAEIIGARVYHKPKGKSYAYGSTTDALDRAVAMGCRGIDVDRRVSKSGTGWWAHQANPTKRDGWYDPTGKIKDHHSFAQLEDADIARLRFKDPKTGRVHRIMRDDEFLRECAERGLVACVETKDYRTLPVAHWERFKAKAKRAGAQVVVMALPGARSAPGRRKLWTAHGAGLPTMWLWRTGSQVPDFVDLVKSHQRRRIYQISKIPLSKAPRRVRRKPSGLNAWQLRRLRRLQAIKRHPKKRLKPFQRRALARLLRKQRGK